jgi:hypothetical protein
VDTVPFYRSLQYKELHVHTFYFLVVRTRNLLPDGIIFLAEYRRNTAGSPKQERGRLVQTRRDGEVANVFRGGSRSPAEGKIYEEKKRGAIGCC